MSLPGEIRGGVKNFIFLLKEANVCMGTSMIQERENIMMQEKEGITVPRISLYLKKKKRNGIERQKGNYLRKDTGQQKYAFNVHMDDFQGKNRDAGNDGGQWRGK